MKQFKILLIVSILASSSPGLTENRNKSPVLGQTISKQELDANAARDIFPDGTGLPPGKGTVSEGKEIYQIYCSSCHGLGGRGGTAEALAGGEGTLSDKYPDKTIGLYWPFATTLFDVIRRSMPLNNPASLKNDEVYAVTAYLLSINEVLGEIEQLSSKSLMAVKMPNENGFISEF